MDDIDDDLGTFQDITDESLGGAPSDRSLTPSFEGAATQEKSLPERARKGLQVLVLGRYKDISYSLRDRLAVFLRGAGAGLFLTAMVAVLFDVIGIHSGPLWEFQVLARELMLQAFALAGHTALQLLNHPLLTLVAVLGMLGALNHYR
jgi:hypothetical protein